MSKEINDNQESKEKKEKGGFNKNFLAGIGAALGIATIGIGGKKAYDKYSENQKKEEQTSTGDSVLKYEGIGDRDQLLLKLNKQRSLKPKIMNDEFDKNYIRANSIIDDDEEEKEKIKSFTCPINQKIMEDPVITPYGTTYERSAILSWIEKNKTDYNSDKKLTEDMLVTNYILQTAIKDYIESLKF